MGYITAYYNTAKTKQYLTNSERDQHIKRTLDRLDELNEAVLNTPTSIAAYKYYNHPVEDVLEAHETTVPGTVYKARQRAARRLEQVFYKDLPNEVMMGEEAALLYVNYMYDNYKLKGKVELDMVFKEVINLTTDVLDKPEAAKVSEGVFIGYKPELDFLKLYVASNFVDKLFDLDIDKISQLIYTLRDPKFNPKLYKLVVAYLIGTGE